MVSATPSESTDNAPSTGPAAATGPVLSPGSETAHEGGHDGAGLPPGQATSGRRWVLMAAVLALIALGSLALAWQANRRLEALQQELVRRQQDSQGQAADARVIARQALDATRETGAKLALAEAKIAEAALQRAQLDELMQSLSHSRDENLVVDIDAAVRLAVQQTQVTGSAEPLLAALRRADERLARVNQPRLAPVRRAIARDAERVKSVALADVSALAVKLDELARLVDELPLAAAAPPKDAVPGAASPAAASKPAPTAAGRTTDGTGRTGSNGIARWLSGDLWVDFWAGWWQHARARLWEETKSLVRVTRIDQPEAWLVAPDQAFFLRENLKLRLLNARLALLARQLDTLHGDLAAARSALERYFERSSRRTQTALELLRQVAAQAQHANVPRPDETLAALATAAAGR